jgi:hypothetical protein
MGIRPEVPWTWSLHLYTPNHDHRGWGHRVLIP